MIAFMTLAGLALMMDAPRAAGVLVCLAAAAGWAGGAA